MLLGRKQSFLGLFITAIRSDRCSVAAFYPWSPLFPNEPWVIPNPVSMVDSGVASHLGPWLPGVMILPLSGCDSVMECSSRVCVFIPCVCVHLPCVCSFPVFISCVGIYLLCVHLLCVCSFRVCSSLVCVFISCVCVHPFCVSIPCVCVHPLCVFISCVGIYLLCVHLLCVCLFLVCSSLVCVFIFCVCSSPICVFISYVCVIPLVYSSPVCVFTHTHLVFASDPSKISLLALGTYLSSLNLDFCSRKPG